MLFEMNRILVCTDLLEKSDEVLRTAETIRKRTNAKVDILYVSDIGLHIEWSAIETRQETYYDKFLTGIKKDLTSRFSEQIKRTGLQGRAIFTEGNIVHEIKNQILNADVKYDLLILGHGGQTGEIGLLHRFLGSVARKIISHADVPTIIVKKKIEFNKIASFVDGSKPLDWMVALSFDFYRVFKFHKIEFVSIKMDLPGPSFNENAMLDFKEQLTDDVEYLSRKGDIYDIKIEPTHEVMLAYHFARIIEEDGVDLAILKRNRGKKLNKKLIGSETLRLLELETSSILVLPV